MPLAIWSNTATIPEELRDRSSAASSAGGRPHGIELWWPLLQLPRKRRHCFALSATARHLIAEAAHRKFDGRIHPSHHLGRAAFAGPSSSQRGAR